MRTVTRWLEVLSLACWIAGIAVTWLITARLPHWRGGPRPNGCYLRDALLIYVECSGTWSDKLFGGLLTWALFWTAESYPVMLWAAMSIIGLPIAALWLVSVFFVARLLLRWLTKPIRPLLRRLWGLYGELLYRLSK